MFDGGSTSSKGITEVSGSLNEKNVIAVTKYSSSTMDEASLRLNEARKEDNHLAIIAIADVAPNAPGLAVLNAESYRKPFGPPVLQVATKEQDWLLKLNKNGIIMLVEPTSDDLPENNFNIMGQLYYSFSTIACIPASKSQEIGMGLGAQAGPKKLFEILNNGGFQDVKVTYKTASNMVIQAKV